MKRYIEQGFVRDLPEVWWFLPGELNDKMKSNWSHSAADTKLGKDCAREQDHILE